MPERPTRVLLDEAPSFRALRLDAVLGALGHQVVTARGAAREPLASSCHVVVIACPVDDVTPLELPTVAIAREPAEAVSLAALLPHAVVLAAPFDEAALAQALDEARGKHPSSPLGGLRASIGRRLVAAAAHDLQTVFSTLRAHAYLIALDKPDLAEALDRAVLEGGELARSLLEQTRDPGLPSPRHPCLELHHALRLFRASSGSAIDASELALGAGPVRLAAGEAALIVAELLGDTPTRVPLQLRARVEAPTESVTIANRALSAGRYAVLEVDGPPRTDRSHPLTHELTRMRGGAVETRVQDDVERASVWLPICDELPPLAPIVSARSVALCLDSPTNALFAHVLVHLNRPYELLDDVQASKRARDGGPLVLTAARSDLLAPLGDAPHVLIVDDALRPCGVDGDPREAPLTVARALELLRSTAFSPTSRRPPPRGAS
ncbi:MAG: hypothetical protein H6720_15330 [Sandaracinus sp.]|nr:hypothetical protein [Sandaracinus sp.]MCB9623983.1 hypothetical protein [Sandaracinus sp.]